MKRLVFIFTIPICGCLLFTSGCGKKRDARAELKLKQATGLPKMEFAPGSPGYSNRMFEWSKELYVGGYQQAGTKNPRWDEAVLDSLEEYSYLRITGHSRNPSETDHLETQLKKAVNAGCSDPFIRYLYLQLVSHAPNATKPQVAADYSNIATRMDATGYGNLLKFYVHLRAAEAWRAASTKQAPEVNHHRRVAMNKLQAILTSEEIPARPAYEACRDLYDAIDKNKKQRTDFYTNTEPILMARWPAEGFPYLIKATFYLDYAWEARGTGWARDVSEAARRLFIDRLDIVEEALNKAWKYDQSIAETPMAGLRLELGQGKGRERMEMWYKRALAFPQNHSEAIRQKLWYLEPRWYGSEEECLAFAREIMKSDLYYDQELLQPFFVHQSFAEYFQSTRPDYWNEPQVWPDVEASFERFFERSGEDDKWRKIYIRCAWRCHRWKKMDEQISKLRDIDYGYFGGQEAFEKMKQLAREQAQKPE